MSAPETSAEERAEADMCLAAIEGQADAWAARVNLNGMIENIASPMRLNRNAPDEVRESFTKRMKEQMDALMRQAFIEGALLAMGGFVVEDEDDAR